MGSHLSITGSTEPSLSTTTSINLFNLSMVSFASTAAGMTGSTVRADNWTGFYQRNRANGGPFQTLSETGASAFARRIKSHLHNVNKLTETVAGSELLTCDGTITGKGLAFILDPRSWRACRLC
jgi:hypothetical protein